jgi:hypothetical protein
MVMAKTPRMKQAWTSVDFNEAPKRDNGKLPGNAEGACGFDSCLFAHMIRSWFLPDRRGTLVQVSLTHLNHFSVM